MALAPEARCAAAGDAWASAFSVPDANAPSTVADHDPVSLLRSRVGLVEEAAICRWIRTPAKAKCLPLPDSGNGRLARSRRAVNRGARQCGADGLPGPRDADRFRYATFAFYRRNHLDRRQLVSHMPRAAHITDTTTAAVATSPTRGMVLGLR